MFKPTHVVNTESSWSAFKKGTKLMFYRNGGWAFNSTPHPETGFPCSLSLYKDEDGKIQSLPSFVVDEIEKEGV